nr:NAD(P)-dependent oxidoreductase [Aurantimonas sp. CSK15Z-1]
MVQPIDPAGIRILRKAGLEVRSAATASLDCLAPLLGDADAVVTRNLGFPAAAMAAAPRLRVIGSHGTGTDHIDRAAAAARGIRIVNTPGTNAQSVAEHALGLMFAAARQIPTADAALRAGDAGFRERVGGLELQGRCLGLWGYGRIAERLGGLAQALGMRVMVLSAHADPAALGAAGMEAAPDPNTLLDVADVLSLHGVPAEAPLLGPAEFARLRQGAILINTARGALIDEAALVEALASGRLRAAALDVFRQEPLPVDSPLCRAPNLILTPHIGGSTEEALRRTGIAVAEAVVEALGAA